MNRIVDSRNSRFDAFPYAGKNADGGLLDSIPQVYKEIPDVPPIGMLNT